MPSRDVEIERKYLLRSCPPEASAAPVVDIDQGYLPGERILERVRRMSTPHSARYYRTVKLGTGIERLEFEEETTEQFFTTVWPLTRGHRVQKRRFTLDDNGVEWVVDQFVDRPLVLAEIELASADAVVRLPSWLSAVLVREVTNEPEYTNFRLAR